PRSTNTARCSRPTPTPNASRVWPAAPVLCAVRPRAWIFSGWPPPSTCAPDLGGVLVLRGGDIVPDLCQVPVPYLALVGHVFESTDPHGSSLCSVQSVNNASTSCLWGIDELAPCRWTVSDAAAAANRIASFGGCPSALATANEPQKVSHAAVEATTCTRRERTLTGSAAQRP